MRLFPLVSSLLVLATVTVQAGQSVKSLTKRFDRLDLNDDGALHMDEFAKLLPAKLTQNNALVQTRTAMFAWFDEDASADIDLSEWLESMSGENAVIPDFSTGVVDELDTNHDGKLTWKEFSRVMNFYVPSNTAREWFSAISGSSSAESSIRMVNRAAFSVTISSDTVSEGILPVAGPRDWVMTTGGDCLAPVPSVSEGPTGEE